MVLFSGEGLNDLAHKACWVRLRASISQYLQMTVGCCFFLQLKESCIERVGWKTPVMHLAEFKCAELSAAWDLFGEGGKDSSPTLSQGMAGLQEHSFVLILVLGLC